MVTLAFSAGLSVVSFYVGYRWANSDACEEAAARKTINGMSLRKLADERGGGKLGSSYWGSGRCTVFVDVSSNGKGEVLGWRYSMATGTLYAQDDFAHSVFPADGLSPITEQLQR